MVKYCMYDYIRINAAEGKIDNGEKTKGVHLLNCTGTIHLDFNKNIEYTKVQNTHRFDLYYLLIYREPTILCMCKCQKIVAKQYRSTYSIRHRTEPVWPAGTEIRSPQIWE